MSDPSETPSPVQLDLSELRLMPDWVANFGAPSSLAKYEEREDRRRDRGDRDGRGPGGGRPGAPRGDRGGAGGGERREFRGGERRDGGGGDKARGDRGPKRFGRRDDRGPPRFQDDRPVLPSGLKVTVEAEDKMIDALAQHVRTIGRAFSVFDATRLVLAGPERHRVRVECEPERLVGLFQVQGDGALFETREEALRYVLRSPQALDGFYTTEEVELEEPKGNFTSIAVCGRSGELLGPPSHHSFQAALKRIHNERFADVPFEVYRRDVRTETSEEIVAKWKEQQRKGMRWVYLKGEVAEGEQPLSFATRAEFEAHFRRTHGDDVVKEVREGVVHGVARREQLSPGLGRLLRRHIEDAKKHLFEASQKIAHGLERRGLKLFKRRGGKMFVSKVKPRAVDPGTVFSERISAIVEQVKADPGMVLSKLLAAFSPPVETSEVPPADGEVSQPSTTELTEDQKGLLRDLHWLADEGYVIIYSDDVLFLGVQGEPPHHTPEAKAAAAAVVASAESAPEQQAGEVEPPPALEDLEPLPTDEEEEAAHEASEHTPPDPSGSD